MLNRRGAVVPGLLLIALGAWLLAVTLGVRLPGPEKLWPGIVMAFGLACLAQFLAEGRRSQGLVFTGVAAALLGGFFLAFTLGPLAWADLRQWWPAVVVIGGLAFLAQWLARPAERGLLLPAALALLVGSAALAITLGRVPAGVAEQITKLWPLLLIAIGFVMLGSYVLSTRRKE